MDLAHQQGRDAHTVEEIMAICLTGVSAKTGGVTDLCIRTRDHGSLLDSHLALFQHLWPELVRLNLSGNNLVTMAGIKSLTDGCKNLLYVEWHHNVDVGNVSDSSDSDSEEGY